MLPFTHGRNFLSGAGRVPNKSTESARGPGPLIWVVILAAVFGGVYWGIGAAIAVGIAVTILFFLIGHAIEKFKDRKKQERMKQIREEYRRKFNTELPTATEEVREIFAGMLGNEKRHHDNIGVKPSLENHTHLPQYMIPPLGHHLKETIAIADMNKAIDLASNTFDKLAIFITRCFDNALHCDAVEWGPKEAKAFASSVFSQCLAPQGIRELQTIADEAVRLGYRAATPLDPSILGRGTSNAWRPELANLIAKAQRCAKESGNVTSQCGERAASTPQLRPQYLRGLVDSITKALARMGHKQAVHVPDPAAIGFLYQLIVPIAFAWVCIQRGGHGPAYLQSAECRSLYEEAIQMMVQADVSASNWLTAKMASQMPIELKRVVRNAGQSFRLGRDPDEARIRAEDSLQKCMACTTTSGRLMELTYAERNLAAWLANNGKISFSDALTVLETLRGRVN